MDRDDDVGVKAGIEGPVVGEKANIEAAEKLALADPEDSDANTIFAAVKIYRELKKAGKDVEIATLTGDPAVGFKADQRIRRQLEEVLQRFPADGFYLVTDGAEDDQVIPILLSYAPIVSKKLVIVKQAKELEKTYYVIKQALKDPTLSKLFLGLPGIVLFLWFALGDLGIRFFVGAIGAYLILKGFGIEDVIISWLKTVFGGISLKTPAAPLYVLSLVLLVIGAVLAVNTYRYTEAYREVETIRMIVGFTAISSLVYLLGKIVDAHVGRRAYRMGRYLNYAALVIVIWILTDATLNIAAKRGTMNELLVAFLGSALFYILVLRFTRLFDITIKLSPKIVGMPVFDAAGRRIGKVSSVLRDEKAVVVEGRRGKRKVPITDIALRGNRILIQAQGG